MARTRRERFGGLRPRPHGRGLLLAARSVHSFGMAEPLRVISLDARGRVRRVALLRPGRVFFDRGACWVVELPACRPAPPVGTALQVVTGLPRVPRGGYAGIHETDHGQAAR
ncbi:MAG: hypothetical protein ABIJ48_08145 [Actinomycetota bacterium]